MPQTVGTGGLIYVPSAKNRGYSHLLVPDGAELRWLYVQPGYMAYFFHAGF
jgi:hypothetical protein